MAILIFFCRFKHTHGANNLPILAVSSVGWAGSVLWGRLKKTVNGFYGKILPRFFYVMPALHKNFQRIQTCFFLIFYANKFLCNYILLAIMRASRAFRSRSGFGEVLNFGRLCKNQPFYTKSWCARLPTRSLQKKILPEKFYKIRNI